LNESFLRESNAKHHIGFALGGRRWRKKKHDHTEEREKGRNAKKRSEVEERKSLIRRRTGSGKEE